jgi:hypothetical protein
MPDYVLYPNLALFPAFGKWWYGLRRTAFLVLCSCGPFDSQIFLLLFLLKTLLL